MTSFETNERHSREQAKWRGGLENSPLGFLDFLLLTSEIMDSWVTVGQLARQASGGQELLFNPRKSELQFFREIVTKKSRYPD